MSLAASPENVITVDKIPKSTRRQRLENGMLVLWRKLWRFAQLSIKVDTILWNIKKVNSGWSTTEHLPKQEEKHMEEVIHLIALTPGMVMEIWTKIPESDQCIVTRYEKKLNNQHET